MTREELVGIIEMYYPADSRYQRTRQIGQKLLEEAKKIKNDWRNEDLGVLKEYARLCIERAERK